ncbi:MAG: phage integrase SAM-like domain-containing protein, partial [Bacteroidota bacterium]
MSFLEFLDQELQEMLSVGMRKGSWNGFRTQVNILKQYADENGNFDYQDVDWNFRWKLIDWLSEKNMQLSYGNRALKVLRYFLERARKKKLHNNSAYQGSGWMVAETKARGHKVYLNPKELQLLSELELNGIQAKVRDLFLIGAATGQRFSDYSKYVSDDFYTTSTGIPLLTVISQKTHMPAKIPLNIFPWLIPILERHQYSSPKVSMQKVNMWIKEICKEAGFTQKVMK